MASKPSIPYVKGAAFEIYRHEPPEPTAFSQVANKRDLDEQERMTILERCLVHPPLPGKLVESVPSLSLHVVKQVSVNDGQSAQIVLCEGNIVAKFYDPLYAAIPTKHNAVDGDPFRCADHDYSHEAAAYKALSKLSESQSSVAQHFPRYFGSYTCMLPTPTGNTRAVRLILIEFIRGTCMCELDPTRHPLPQSFRKNIMAKIIDAESSLSMAGLVHRDLYPRNIILCGFNGDRETMADTNCSSIRVVILDFGSSRICHRRSRADSTGRPISPILRWDKRRERHIDWELLGWVDWEWQPWVEERWRNSSAYAPITEELKKTWLGMYDRIIRPPPFQTPSIVLPNWAKLPAPSPAANAHPVSKPYPTPSSPPSSSNSSTMTSATPSTPTQMSTPTTASSSKACPTRNPVG